MPPSTTKKTLLTPRLKKNIVPFAAMLDKVAALRPVEFDWRAAEFPEKHFGEGRSFGLIAQEVETVIGEIMNEAAG